MLAASIARTLSEVSDRLARLGRHADALKLSEEAVEIYRELASDRPDEFGLYLAAALERLGDILAALGRSDEAAAARQEAAEAAVERAGMTEETGDPNAK